MKPSRLLSLAAVSLALILSGCNTESTLPGVDAGLDAGPVPDGGPVGGDGGRADGGMTEADASVADAGGDAGTPPDAGPAPGTCTSNDGCADTEYCRRLAGCGGEGTCEPRPTVCTRVYLPVCGCDGVTYGNACNAEAAGVNVASPGECGGPLECLRNDQCGRTEFCAGDACGSTGACAERPTACTDEWAPVCGCDGVTYGNGCEAAAAGVRVAADGACATTTACTTNDQCATTDYCEGRSCEGAGACLPRPEACTRERAPVCGCDGVTYGNGCEAARAGVRVASAGECAPATVDCLTNRDCDRTEFCAGDICGSRGTCTIRPEICATMYDPVCGCDGVTYTNACAAASAGVRVAAPGECSTTAGCTDNSQCGRSEYCAADTCGGIGSCLPRPGSCPTVLDPVCGCDGVTYRSSCEAERAGVRVASTGACADECAVDADCVRWEYCAECRSVSGPVRVCLPRGSTC